MKHQHTADIRLINLAISPDDRPAHKAARRVEETLNRLANTAPGKGRTYQLDRLADELEIYTEASADGEFDSATRLDFSDEVLFLRRLVHDLHALRDAIRGNARSMPVNFSRNDPDQWREEDRP